MDDTESQSDPILQCSTKMEAISLGGEQLNVPACLLEDSHIFSEVLSGNTWDNVLTEEERTRLEALLPQTKGDHPQPDKDMLKLLFSGGNVRFGNPIQKLWEKMHYGSLSPEVVASQQHLVQLKQHQYKLSQQARYVAILRELLLSRQHLLQEALFSGALENLSSSRDTEKPAGQRRRESTFTRLLHEIRKECDQGSAYMSSDEEEPANQITDDTVVTDDEYRQMLQIHRTKRKMNKTSAEQAVKGLETRQNLDYSRSFSRRRVRDKQHAVSKRLKTDQEVGVAQPVLHRSRSLQRVEGMDVNTDAHQAVYEAYRPLDNTGSTADPPLEPVRIEGPLPVAKFMSFFSLLRHIFTDNLDGKGELSKLVKYVRHAMRSPEVSCCVWGRRRPNWSQLTLSAICYLAAEVGAVSSFSPLAHFIPVIEFRDRIDHWKWIGAGRDNDVDLLILCDHWLQSLPKILPVVDYSEYEPPPPHVWTRFTFRSCSPKEIMKFQQLERDRYASPQKSFTYMVHGFEAPVGPVKGSRSTKREASSKARGHALLIPERPTCVTILSLVRDATSRLPNGEGTRIDLCVLVQDSQYLSDNVSDSQLNNAVSGALDRLHYEKDPCVRYDGSRKVWIYLHRSRNEEDFERIFWACEVAANQRKKLMSRPRIRPRVIMSVDSGEVILDPGGPAHPLEDIPVKPPPKKRSTNTTPKTAPSRSSGTTPSEGTGGKTPRADQGAQSSSKKKTKHSQKLSDQQTSQQQRQQSTSKIHPSPLTAQPTTSLQSSDWGSSDEEQVLPFLDSSLVSIEDKLSQDSASSWHSSDSGAEEGGVTIAMESNPRFPSSTNQMPARLPSITTPTFMTESAGPSHFLTPTQNFLPGTPTVITPTFIPDISMGDESDVLSQQFGGNGAEKSLQPWLSSGSTTPS
ncbi:nuclear factor related to kappa-B-binding protein-like isoform X2 [Halichondria panicea]|uniref:nuclear factor related to kappa-B-binding protein-like isoform X2 n=1 Tax=Halichondria panicea TaxID=6063 RepID=UPI00312B3681